jgi:hypothetical protein
VAIEPPGWLVTAFYLIGLPWPGIDEDQLRAWALSVRAFADDVTTSSARTHQTVVELAASSQSSSVETLAAHWEHRNQLVADLHGPMNIFADALDVAADVVVAQKYVVIAAATLLAEEFIATQIEAIFTDGLAEAELPAEIISTREIVDAALQFLEAELLGKLIGAAVDHVTSHLSHFLGEFLGIALPVAGEVAGLKLAYDSVRDAAYRARVHAADTEEIGKVAYQENANRDIEDSAEHGNIAGDGGRWAMVVHEVEQGLLYIAQVLFKSLSEAVSEIQEATAHGLNRFANAIEDADESLGHDFRHPGIADGGDSWETVKSEFTVKWSSYKRDHPAPPEVASATLDDTVRVRLEPSLQEIRRIEAEDVTPFVHRIAAEDPHCQLIGLESRLKDKERIFAKVAKDFSEKPGITHEQALANIKDAIRYTMKYSDAHYTEGVAAAVRRLEDAGFRRVDIKNYWNGDQVKGINSTWEVPGSGQRFEVQFHTQKSFEASRLTHPVYERLRIRTAPAISLHEWGVRGAEKAAMQDLQRGVNQHVPVPAAAHEIRNYPVVGARNAAKDHLLRDRRQVPQQGASRWCHPPPAPWLRRRGSGVHPQPAVGGHRHAALL